MFFIFIHFLFLWSSLILFKLLRQVMPATRPRSSCIQLTLRLLQKWYTYGCISMSILVWKKNIVYCILPLAWEGRRVASMLRSSCRMHWASLTFSCPEQHEAVGFQSLEAGGHIFLGNSGKSHPSTLVSPILFTVGSGTKLVSHCLPLSPIVSQLVPGILEPLVPICLPSTHWEISDGQLMGDNWWDGTRLEPTGSKWGTSGENIRGNWWETNGCNPCT